jgi:allantoin racemase
MNHILLINPNSSAKMTADIRNTVAALTVPGVDVAVVKMDQSPDVLESFADYTLAGREIIIYFENLARKKNREYDGVLLACFGDPCLQALKEICEVPVIGIAEAAFSMALLMGFKFAILAASSKAQPMMEFLVKSYGLEGRLASVETLDLQITDFINDQDVLRENVRKAAARAIAKGAEVLILGCAGMTMLGDELGTLAGIPVIDPVATGVSMLNAMLETRCSISRGGLFSRVYPFA